MTAQTVAIAPIEFGLLTELGGFRHCVEASTLGLEPGQWPETLPAHRSLGNGQPLRRIAVETRDDEILSVDYRQVCGVIRVRVFND